MANGERAAWLSNRLREFWQARPPFVGGSSRGRGTKKITHRTERRASCRDCGVPWVFGQGQVCDACDGDYRVSSEPRK